MSTRKTTLFYAVLIAVAFTAVGMVIASRLDMSQTSSAQTLSVPQANSAPLSGPIDASTFRNIAKNQTPAVVNIRTEQRQKTRQLTQFFGGGQGQGDDLFERFFGQGRGRQRGDQNDRPDDEIITEGAGSGFIIDKAGYILTNNHVIEGATDIRVSLYDSQSRTRLPEEYPAKVIGRDPLTDSALIQMTELPKQPLQEIRFGDSDQLQAGDWVMAIGNPFNLHHTVSVGVVSAIGRPAGGYAGREVDMIQTDAAINPGNSGGPLLNVRGEVVGINTAIYTDQRSANIGIGFALPINSVRDLLPQLRAGKVIRGRIGVQVQRDPISQKAAQSFGLPGASGAVISSVNEGGPADKAGLRPGDVVTEYNGKPVKDSDQLVDMVVHTKPGSTVPLKVYRNKQQRSMNLTVEELNLDEEMGVRGGEDEEQNPPEEKLETGLGLELSPVTPELARRLRLPDGEGGAVVTRVERNSAASRAGVGPQDVILEVNQRPVNSMSDLRKALTGVQSGDTVFLLVWRSGQEVFITLQKP
ncbi:MAG: Do family serine endopeptidase [Acidobacteriota bacterium]